MRGMGTSSPAPLDEWDRGWQSFWKEAGFTPYELPASARDAAHRETQFLMTARTPEREIERLKRIQAEFVRGFRGLHALGPAVTVFGSAFLRPQGHAREVLLRVHRDAGRAGNARRAVRGRQARPARET
jgi:hypothetical protein